MTKRPVRSFVALGVLCVAWFAGIGKSLATTPLVSQPIDDLDVVTLAGNTRPEATAANDRGAVPDGLQLDHLQLLLQRSPEQEQEVEDFIASLHDHTSPNFHQWLSAGQFGARFGASPADLDAIQGWLTHHGLIVNAVFPSRMTIDFSGTSGQVAAAFHTEIHRSRSTASPTSPTSATRRFRRHWRRSSADWSSSTTSGPCASIGRGRNSPVIAARTRPAT